MYSEASWRIRYHQLKTILRQINTDGRSIHDGLLLAENSHCSQHQQFGTSMPRYQAHEESISSAAAGRFADCSPSSSRKPNSTCGFDSVFIISMGRQRFTCVRLFNSHLPVCWTGFSAVAHDQDLLNPAAPPGLKPASAGRFRGASPHLQSQLARAPSF